MKILKLIFILSVSLAVNAQDLSQWQIGVNANPFFYNRIERRRPGLAVNDVMRKGNQKIINGFGFGLTLEKNWNEHFGLKTGFELCNQNQFYLFKYTVADGNIFTIDLNISYYKIPVMVQYSKNIAENLFFTAKQGLQLSVFKSQETKYFSHGQQESFGANDDLFNKNLLGYIGSFGVKYLISDRLSYTANIRYEMDFTLADRKVLQVIVAGNTFDEVKTRNARVGFEFGIQYHFSMDNVRFNKNPLKL